AVEEVRVTVASPWNPKETGSASEKAGGPSSGPFHALSSISTGAAPSPSKSSTWSRMRTPMSRFTSKHDVVKLAYVRMSFLFALSVLVTWVPATINRIYGLVAPNSFSFGLNLASAFVVSLQGVWNAVIFFTVNWKIVREKYVIFRRGRKGS